VGTAIVVTAGLAEIAAGSIAMGMGGYMAARTDTEHYDAERARETVETADGPEKEKAEIASIFSQYGLGDSQIKTIVETLSKDRNRWVDFMMRFELGLDTPDPKRARVSAFTIAASYIVGGLIPLSPYMIFKDINVALWSSVIITMLALFVFGYIKGKFTGLNPLRGGLQTILVGGLAAGVAFILARLLG